MNGHAGGSSGLCVVFFDPSDGSGSPVEKEYHDAVRQAKERAKIDGVLARMALHGWSAPGLRVEKVAGAREGLLELKVSAFGSEHRFLAAGLPWRAADGAPILVLLKYVKKKTRRLRRGDIDSAQGRLLRLEAP